MRSERLRRGGDIAWPVLLVLVPGLLGTGRAGADETGWTRAPDALAYALVVLAAFGAAWLHRRPGVTLGCVAVAIVGYLSLGYPVGPVLVGVPVAAAGTALGWSPRRVIVANGGFGLALLLAGALRFADELTAGRRGDLLDWLFVSGALVVVPTAVGVAVRGRREADARVRAERARRATAEERLRMAQELHDSVGHGLAVIAMQAGVALYVLERAPDRARASLEAIQAASRDALHGMRVQLGLWRDPDGADGPRRPAPGLADVEVLLDRIRGGGVAVAAELRAGELPPEVDVVAYRLLQESLTNVLRYAGPTRAQVRAVREGDDLVLQVTDEGPAPGAGPGPAGDGGSGSGIAGMRARTEALGGEFHAGPRPGGGFAVRARLPLAGRVERTDVPGSVA
ncbi:histidine kinase [Micromonospora sp. NPDC049559]|uniref:sensor histidine kinase n=1 Tax=Micromonospora sp. NPDC049559 TaxID=3155923 RepID=UPI0034207578